MLQDLARALAGLGSAEAMVDLVVATALTQPGVVGAGVFLVEVDVVRSTAWRGQPAGSSAFDVLPLDADTPVSVAVRTGLPVHGDVGDLEARFPAYAAAWPHAADQVLHVVPLLVENESVGALVLTLAPGAPDEAELLEFARAVADVLALGLGRADGARRLDARRRRELALVSAQADALAGVINGEPLVGVLDKLVTAVEEASPSGVLASVLLLDEDGRRLRHGSAPSLPADYNAVIDGIEIGPSVGSCGTAAHRRSRVVVTDIETDPLWADFRGVAAQAGVRACWSTPILGVTGDLLGTFALYYRTPRSPVESDLASIDVLAGTFALIIERSRAEARGIRLQDEAARRLGLELAVAAGGVGTWNWDLVTGELVYDAQLLDIFGIADQRETLVIDDFLESVHPGDRDRVRAALERAIELGVDYEAEYRVLLPDGRHRWVSARGRTLADRAGRPVRVIGAAQDTTTRREAQASVARMLDSLSTGFFFLDSGWRFTFVNGAAERVLGRPRDELLGHSVWEEYPESVGTDFEDNYRRAVETGDPVSFDAYYPEPLNAWYEVRAWPGPDGLAVYFLDVTDRKLAQQSALRDIERAGLLAQVSEELAGTVERREAMGRLAGLVVPTMADWCVVTLIEDDRTAGTRQGLGAALGWHADPALRDLADEYARTRLSLMTDDGLVQRTVEVGSLQLLEGNAREVAGAMFAPGSRPPELLDRLGTHSAVVLPLSGQEQAVGMLTVVNSATRGAFSEDDVAVLRDVAARAGLALDRARLYRQQRAVAETLQRSLLRPPQTRDGVTMAVAYVPAAEVAQVGGDWYDAFNHPDGSTTLIIGDVMGHDLLAAAAMGEIRILLRSVAAQHHGDPALTLDQAERVMGDLDQDTLATAFVGRLGAAEPGSPGLALSYAVAGHPPPLVLRPGGEVDVLDSDHVDPLLGIGHQGRQRRERVLEDGSVLVLYTDGLVERRDQSVDVGIERLRGSLGELRGCDAETVRDRLLAEMQTDRAEDDVALLVVRVDLANVSS